MTKSQKVKVTNNATFAAVIGAIVGGAIGVFVSPVVLVDHYISNDDISKSINTHLVKTGYVDSSVLELDTYEKQLTKIQSIFEEYSVSVEDTLINLGMSADVVSGLSEEQRLVKMPDQAAEVYSSLSEISGKLDEASLENTELKAHIAKQTSGTLSAASLVINGETMNEGASIANAVFENGGKYYYSGGFLTSYLLDDTLKFDSSEAKIIYGNEKPEKERLSWQTQVSDPSNAEYYALGGDAVVMGTNEYHDAVRLKNKESYFYIHLNGEYSELSFIVGHVDGSKQNDAVISVYQISDDNLSYTKELASYKLTGEMLPTEYHVDLNYTDAVKIVCSRGNLYAYYGLAEMYLYR